VPLAPPTRFVADEVKATYRPSELIKFSADCALPAVPPEEAEASFTWPPVMSLRKTWPPLAPLMRFVANEVKDTYRPSPLMDGSLLAPFPFVPDEFAEHTSTWPVSRSFLKTWTPLAPPTRFVASDTNTTKCPSALTRAS
jgi:hypothetical protein